MKKIIYIFDSATSLKSLPLVEFLVDRKNLGIEAVGLIDDSVVCEPGCSPLLDRLHVVKAVTHEDDPCYLDPAACIAALANEVQNPAETVIISYGEYTSLIAAELRRVFGIAGPQADNVLPFRDKLRMKEQVAPHARVPAFRHFDKTAYFADKTGYVAQLAKGIGFPLLIKPVNAASAIGTKVLKDIAEIELIDQALQEYTGPFEVEEYIDGNIYHCEILFKEGQALIGFASRFNHPVLALNQGWVVGSMPLASDDPLAGRIIEFCTRAHAGFSQLNGITHSEVIMKDGTGEIVFIETACRAPGGRVLECYLESFGVNLLCLDQRIKAGLALPEIVVKKGKFSFWAVLPAPQGRIKSLRVPSFDSEVDIRWKAAPGDVIDPTVNFETVLGVMFAKNDRLEGILADFERVAQEQFFVMEEIKPLVILVCSKRETFTNHVLKRTDVDVCFLNFVKPGQAVVQRNQGIGQFDFLLKNNYTEECRRFQRWCSERSLTPDYFCNPNEEMQHFAQRFARDIGLPALTDIQVEIVRNKVAMKEFYHRIGVPCATHVSVATHDEIIRFAEQVGYPLVVKPLDSDSCIDTYKVNGPEQMPILGEHRCWMAEEYIKGEEYQICAIVQKGTVLAVFVASNPAPILNVFDGAMNANITLAPSEPKPIDAQKVMQHIVDGLKIDRGYVHGEFFIKESGEFVMSEIAARPSGCEAPTNHELSYGFDFNQAILDTYLDKQPDLTYSADCSVGDLPLPARAGRVTRISTEEELRVLDGVIDCKMHFHKGDMIVPQRSSGFCSGYVLIKGADSKEVKAKMEKVLQFFDIETESELARCSGTDN
ncbi:ATP-grasp domain-containing protein [Yokenella regensburgei]|uniref:ATP-grasp domain-containing protein n=1 Tax=Yokenella regensburgei TaxID=158877 RepID=UPI0013763113|nr:ATP-grasp domain-containing protein [Yokenella regensburgei]KAF1366606.1 biotin carboxylase [Yokenella regensburgei]